jgi:hypothetical protein
MALKMRINHPAGTRYPDWPLSEIEADSLKPLRTK